MTKLKELILDPAWLFDLGFMVRRWRGPAAREESLEWELDESYRIPAMAPLSSEDAAAQRLESRMAWGEFGALWMFTTPHEVAGPGTPLFSRTLQLMIDTRSSPGIHRATSYCHEFRMEWTRPDFEPFGWTPMNVEPVQISRARAPLSYRNVDKIRARVTHQKSAVRVQVFVPYISLNGCNPQEFPEWGVMWVLTDSRNRRYVLARGVWSVPLDDPSLWCRARLIEG